MPVQPVKPEKVEPKVEIIPGEVPQPEKPAVEVEVDAKTGQPVAAPSVDALAELREELKKERARNEYQLRQQERTIREMRDQMARFQVPTPQPGIQPEKPKPEDSEFGPELDAIAQQDWKKGVSVIAEKLAEAIAEKKFKALMEEQKKQQQEDSRKQDLAIRIERSRNSVIQRTPSLQDETSEEYKSFWNVYNQTLQEDPNLLTNPHGPEVVELRWRLSQAQSKTPEKLEAERLARVAGGATPQSRPISSNNSNTIKLTEDELDLCKRKGISPAAYAQAKQANLKEGVTA